MAAAKRTARIELTASSAGMDRGIADAKRKLRMMERDQARKAKQAERDAVKREKRINSAMFGVGARVGGMAFDAVTGMVGEAANTERDLTRLQISGDMSSESMRVFRNELMGVSEATGVARSELVKGAAQYVAITGDAAGATDALKLFAEVSNASGASMADISATAASLRQNLKIDPKDFRKAFDVLITQGKSGAVELRDLAQQASNVMPSFSLFKGGEGVEGLSEASALLQVVRKDFSNADEAATGFRGMLTEIKRHADKLGAAGVKVFDPKTGKLRNALEIIKEVSKNKTLMKPGELLGALGEEKAERAMNAIIMRLDEVNRLKSESLNSDAVAKDNAAYLASASGRMATAWNHVKNALAEAFTPERAEKFAEALEGIAGVLADVVRLAAKAIDMVDHVRVTKKDRLEMLKGLSRHEKEGEDVTLYGSSKGKFAVANRMALMSEQELADMGPGFTTKERDEAMADLYKQAIMPDMPTMIALQGLAVRRGSLQRNAFDAKLPSAQVDTQKIEASINEGRLANAIVNALQRAGLGNVKIGAEPAQRAVANSTNHRRGH